MSLPDTIPLPVLLMVGGLYLAIMPHIAVFRLEVTMKQLGRTAGLIEAQTGMELGMDILVKEFLMPM